MDSTLHLYPTRRIAAALSRDGGLFHVRGAVARPQLQATGVGMDGCPLHLTGNDRAEAGPSETFCGSRNALPEPVRGRLRRERAHDDGSESGWVCNWRGGTEGFDTW